MAKSKTARVADLKAKFNRITTALKAGDALMDKYLEQRAQEFEAFNAVVSEFTTEEQDEETVN